MRLASGTRAKGRVEIKHDDEWGTVCHTGWDDADAAVLCKSVITNRKSNKNRMMKIYIYHLGE